MKEKKTGIETYFAQKNGKKLRYGYTTGSCAAAAASAATQMLLTRKPVEEVLLQTPKGILLRLYIEEIRQEKDSVTCAVRKDGGDDPDVTDGILVYATVSKRKSEKSLDGITAVPQQRVEKYTARRIEQSTTIDCENAPQAGNLEVSKNGIYLDGGIGVGRVTKAGLYQRVGEAAINKVPREMIFSEVQRLREQYKDTQPLDVVISIPAGVQLAEKTFNPRLGIKGGISVLGTSGIVIPMSEHALIESIRLEMQMLVAKGGQYLVISPGNYGETFAKAEETIDMTYFMKCSNYLGETLDLAEELGVKGILFIAHIGKFIKVSGGIMNTHSRQADCRAELLAAQAMRAGASEELVRALLNTITTEEGVALLKEASMLDPVMEQTVKQIQFYLDHHTGKRIKTGVILFSNVEGKLAETKAVSELLELLEKQRTHSPTYNA